MDIRPDHTKRIWTIGHSKRSFEDFVFLFEIAGDILSGRHQILSRLA